VGVFHVTSRYQVVYLRQKRCGEWLSVAGMRRKGFATRRELAMDRRFDTIVVASLGTYIRKTGNGKVIVHKAKHDG
jgi:hypothetical protein